MSRNILRAVFIDNRVRRLAGLRQRSPRWIMREAIREYVMREAARESFRQEALASWSAYHEIGLHLTAEEVRAWLGTWGKEAEADDAVYVLAFRWYRREAGY
jgi:predicted transcriptional regulator